MGANEIRAALDLIPYPVTVVSVGRGGVENALTVAWLTQASFDPPMVLFVVDKGHYSEEILRSTKNFVVNVLGADQAKLAGHFARQSMSGESKLDRVPTREADSGASIITDAVAWLDCEVASIHPAGDHLVVIGRVLDGAVQRQAEPLSTASGLRYRKRS
jgi:flavin reductase (DIM6/NTAB) family NADH-FMN oxidoreductase RutF